MEDTNLEKVVLYTAKQAISQAIEKELVGYGKPLSKIVEGVIDENRGDIHEIMNKAFKKVIRTKEFEETVLKEFQHKVAKILVSGLTGGVDKAVNALRQDPTLKAKMIIAIENIISEAR